MRILFLFFLSLTTSVTLAQRDLLHNQIKEASDKIETKMIAWRRDFHEHPELGNNEIRTAGIVEKHLRSLGMEVKTGVAVTGVVGVLKGNKPGPVVALRADMDALPIFERNSLPFASKVKAMHNGQETGVMHACGHDSHTAVLMAVAEILSSIKKDLKGTVKFIFQPAEEGLAHGIVGGAKLMVAEGVMKNPRPHVIFGLHSDPKVEAGKITYRPGGTLASVNDFQIVIKGKQAHGANPWFSVDPIVIAAQVINNLQTIVSRSLNITKNPGVITIGSIHGGNRSNIIPEQVELIGTMRAFSIEDQKMMTGRLKQIATKSAEAAGGSAEVVIPHSVDYPVTYNDPALMTKMLPYLTKAIGEKNVLLANPETGAEDFSFYQQEVPGLFLMYGVMPAGQDPAKAAPRHTPDFFLEESGMKVGVRTLASLTIDYLFL